MAQKKLGRGLAELGLTELLSDFNKSIAKTNHPSTVMSNTEQDTISAEGSSSNASWQEILITQLVPGRFQPRQHFDEDLLKELAESIKIQGIIQPIIARPLHSIKATQKKITHPPLAQFEIIAGERRWRAAQIAGLQQVPVIIKNVKDQDAIALALIENIQRHDLNALEEAEALHRLLTEFQLTHQEAANAVGKSRTTITNLLRLLNLHVNVKQLLISKQLEMGHARALLTLPMDHQFQIAEKIISKQLSVRATEEWIRELLNEPSLNSASSQTKPTLEKKMTDLQFDLRKKLNTKVSIKPQKNGQGKLIIHYRDWDKLNNILKNLLDQNEKHE